MNSIKKTGSLGLSLALLTMLLLSLHTPLAHADAGGIVLNVSRITSTIGGTIQGSATLSLNSQGSQNLYPDGTVIRIHMDVSISSSQTTPSTPGTPVYSGDFSVTLVNNGATIAFAFPSAGPGYYLIVVSAYAPDGTLLASGWVDPHVGGSNGTPG